MFRHSPQVQRQHYNLLFAKIKRRNCWASDFLYGSEERSRPSGRSLNFENNDAIDCFEDSYMRANFSLMFLMITLNQVAWNWEQVQWGKLVHYSPGLKSIAILAPKIRRPTDTFSKDYWAQMERYCRLASRKRQCLHIKICVCVKFIQRSNSWSRLWSSLRFSRIAGWDSRIQDLFDPPPQALLDSDPKQSSDRWYYNLSYDGLFDCVLAFGLYHNLEKRFARRFLETNE